MIHPDLSIIVHVYNAQETIDEHINNWENIPKDFINRFEFICIDDFSEIPIKIKKTNLNIRLFRVLDDIDWNMPGCKNLGAIHSKADWILFHDADNFAAPLDLCKLISNLETFNKETLYRFGRSLKGFPIESHINTLLLNKDNFLKAGMLDEDFSGNYGYEDVHFNMIWSHKIGPIVLINDIVFDQKDMKTENLNRDTTINQALGTDKIYARNFENSSGKIRFMWTEEVLS